MNEESGEVELIEDGVYFSDFNIEQIFFMAESVLMILV